MINLTPQTTTGSTTTAAAPWKSYEQYFAGNPTALDYSGYLATAGKPMDTTSGVGGNWGNRGNPYRFRNEYNQYRSTLSPEYQYLSGAGITPEAVSSGAITGYMDPKTGKRVPVGQGLPLPETAVQGGTMGVGSSHSLSSDILNKMWR